MNARIGLRTVLSEMSVDDEDDACTRIEIERMIALIDGECSSIYRMMMLDGATMREVSARTGVSLGRVHTLFNHEHDIMTQRQEFRAWMT